MGNMLGQEVTCKSGRSRGRVFTVFYLQNGLLQWKSGGRKHSKPFLSSHEGNHWVITAVFVYRTTYTLAN